MKTQGKKLRARQGLGKYRIEKCLASGGFADVYRAYDTIEGIRVALKIPHAPHLDDELLQDFKKEARLTARLDHPNILPIKNAAIVDGLFVIASGLGDESLGDRLKRRISLERALDVGEQVLAGLAHAHEHRVMHCDVKPDNFMLFGDRVRLTDFGISRLALRTMQASGSGTIGFMAPEQAMGHPSFRSDVFSAGLVLYRLFAGQVPQWPFEWPPPDFARVRQRLHPDLIAFLRRSLRIEPKRRFEDAVRMHEAYEGLMRRALRHGHVRRRPKTTTESRPDWKGLRIKHFKRHHKKDLEAHHACSRCKAPLSESMLACPWCGTARKIHRGETRFPARCPRCLRGVKLDWPNCAWCYGASIGPLSTREYSDRRYAARCANYACERRELLPFSRYCPWCRTKVRRQWTIPGHRDRCGGCGWGVLRDHWTTCPWCARSLSTTRSGSTR